MRRKIASVENLSGEEQSGQRKETIKQILREHTAKDPRDVLKNEHVMADEEKEKHAEEIKFMGHGDQKHQEQIEGLLALARERGILNAVSVLNKMDSPHLWDDFHDALAFFFQEQNKK